MSTKASVHFQQAGKTEAIVYIHSDGHPDGLGEDLKAFLQDVDENCKDKRFNDPGYLAVKFVVWQMDSYHQMHQAYGEEEHHFMDEIGVGIYAQDQLDIDYRYKLACDNYNKMPKIVIEEV